MYSRDQLKEECSPVIYKRGIDIFRNNVVVKLNISEIDESQLIRVTAKVKGSSSNSYNVELVIDEDSEELSEYNCSCPAYYQYDGVCKHCVAVALSYISERERRSKLLPESMLEYKEPIATTTTRGLSKVMGYYDTKAKLALMQQPLKGTVRLTPVFSRDYGTMEVEYKIGNERNYVLKNISAFVRAMQNMENVSYGQKLSFYHTIDCFTKSSVPMVQFLIKEVGRKNQLKSSYFSVATEGRCLQIHASNIDDFMAALGEEKLEVASRGSRSSYWQIKQEKPNWDLQITGEKGGVNIKGIFPEVIQGLDYTYFWQDGTIYKVANQETEDILPFLQFTSQMYGDNLFVSKTELSVFCRELLPVLRKMYTVETQNFEEVEYLPPRAEYEIYLDAPQKDMISCKLYAVYGESKFNVYAQVSGRAMRDEMGEIQIGQAVSQFFNALDPENDMMILSGDEDRLYWFLTEGIEQLQSLATVYVSDSLKSIEVKSSPKATVGISLTGDLLELSLQSEDMDLSQLAEILSRYDRKKKYYRLKDGTFVTMADTNLDTIGNISRTLQLSENELKGGKVLTPKYRALYLDSELREDLGIVATRDKNFKALIRNMKTIEDNDYEIPISLESVLREYQKAGFLWLKTMKNNGFGGILADDMGLGKTLQVIAFLLSEKEEAPEKNTLIVCPASLVYNWKNEFEHFAPSLSVVTVTGAAFDRKWQIENREEGDILVTSYDLLKRDIKFYEDISFGYQIIDEAQYIKNHTTLAAEAVKKVQAGFKLALTGTPIENRLSELWSIFDYLMPGFLYNYNRFRNDFEIPIVQNASEADTARLQRMIRPFVLRRLKKDVLKDLPDKLEENVVSRLEGEQEELYRAHVQRIRMMLDKQTEKEFAKGKIQILAELTKLRQLCCDPSLLYEDYKGPSAKREMCISLLKNAVDGGHKVLVFSQFTTMLSHLEEELHKEGIKYYTLTGATSKEKRAALVDQFNAGDIPVFLISLKAGGTGLNLTAADIVIHYDPWWNVAVQNQATDRAHRIGQKQVVTVYKLTAKDTIEEKIVKLQEMKKELAEQLLEAEGFSAPSFSKDELMDLLKN